MQFVGKLTQLIANGFQFGRRNDERLEPIILIVTLLGTIGCCFVAFWPDPPDYRALAKDELKKIGLAEHRANQRFQVIWNGMQRGTSEERTAARIEREVLPLWQEGRKRVDHACRGEMKAYVDPRIPAFFHLREIAWHTLIDALRSNDSTQVAEFQAEWERANALADAIRMSESTLP